MSSVADEAIEEADSALSEKERRFCDAYMSPEAAGNGVKACRLAGYKGSDAVLATTAWRLLRKADIKASLDARLEHDPLVAGRVERLRLLTEIVRGELTEERLDTRGEVHVIKPSLADRMKALEALAKAAGEHVQRSSVEVHGLPENATIAQLLELAQAGRK